MRILRTFKIETAVHVLIGLFTLTSFANVRAFLIGAGHDALAASLLSCALGAALAVVSLALSKIDHGSERATFLALVIVGSGLALLSGALQASEYAGHLGALWAIALGFGTPVLGEIGLSLASALFSRSQRRAELRGINQRIEAAIVGNLDQAIASFDPSQIQRRIDRTLNRVALAAVGGVEANLLALYGDNRADTMQPVGSEIGDVCPNVEPTTDTLAVANAARLSKKQANMDRTFALIQCGDRSVDQIAGEIGVTSKTIGRYVEEFRTAGHPISVNGVVKLC